MPNLTTKLKLKKPLLTEAVDINVINENMDILDANIDSANSLRNKMVALNRYFYYPETMTGAERIAFQNDTVAWNYFLNNRNSQALEAIPKRFAQATYYEILSNNTVANKIINIDIGNSNFVKIVLKHEMKPALIVNCKKVNGVWNFSLHGVVTNRAGATFTEYECDWEPKNGMCTYKVEGDVTQPNVPASEAYNYCRVYGYNLLAHAEFGFSSNGYFMDIGVNLKVPVVNSNSVNLSFIGWMKNGHSPILATTATVQVF